MAFDGNEGAPISVSRGAELTKNYRSANPGARKGHFFGREILLQILAQEDCMGIRMYYGQDADGQKELVIVGADASENDMLNLVADISSPCPPCGGLNALNS